MEHTDALNKNELTYNNSYFPVCNLLHFDFQSVASKILAGCHYLTFFFNLHHNLPGWFLRVSDGAQVYFIYLLNQQETVQREHLFLLHCVLMAPRKIKDELK